MKREQNGPNLCSKFWKWQIPSSVYLTLTNKKDEKNYKKMSFKIRKLSINYYLFQMAKSVAHFVW